MSRLFYITSAILLFVSCKSGDTGFDATGTFESDEVIVSAEQNGQLLQFNVNEGDNLTNGQVVGYIDSTNLILQRAQVTANIHSLSEKTFDVQPQIKLLQDQLATQQTEMDHLLREKNRTKNLVEADAAPRKQLDDMNDNISQLQKQMDVTKQQIAVQQNNTGTQNRSILSETDPLKKQVAQINEQISKTNIINPVTGTVLAKYAEQGEITATGKALYKIADLSYLNLRAYLTGDQLSLVKLNQLVMVRVDSGADHYRSYQGTITWISDQAEFTPKTIQTKDERANLVYAIKIRVKNDGFLKIGMYGEVKLNP